MWFLSLYFINVSHDFPIALICSDANDLEIPPSGWCANCKYVDCVDLPNYDWCDYNTVPPTYTCPGHF